MWEKRSKKSELCTAIDQISGIVFWLFHKYLDQYNYIRPSIFVDCIIQHLCNPSLARTPKFRWNLARVSSRRLFFSRFELVHCFTWTLAVTICVHPLLHYYCAQSSTSSLNDAVYRLLNAVLLLYVAFNDAPIVTCVCALLLHLLTINTYVYFLSGGKDRQIIANGAMTNV